jgi:hypothetical protein
VAAVGLAALRHASDLWAGMMLLVALAAVGIAGAGAIILRGPERSWWATFAFFAGGYLAPAIGPEISPWFRNLLGTTRFLNELHSLLVAEVPAGNTY